MTSVMRARHTWMGCDYWFQSVKQLGLNKWRVVIMHNKDIIFGAEDVPSKKEADAFAIGFIRGIKLYQEAVDCGHHA